MHMIHKLHMIHTTGYLYVCIHIRRQMEKCACVCLPITNSITDQRDFFLGGSRCLISPNIYR